MSPPVSGGPGGPDGPGRLAGASARSGPAVVACGGGHGLAASLQALRHLSERITAVVTVADDGGSSGRLRSELGVMPPGDLRMALAALCDDTEWGRTWRDVLQHRFTSDGPLAGHAVGNLLIAALWQQLGDSVEGLDLVGRLLGARGRVLPMSSVPLAIEADVRMPAAPDHPGGPDRVEVVRGQAAVATTTGRVEGVRLLPPDPPARPEVVEAVRSADWVVLGPGSWFTSVMPHLLVPELAAALRETPAQRCLVLNLVSEEKGETRGMGQADHVRALTAHARGLRLDVVLADPSAVEDVDELADVAAEAGAQLVLRQVRRRGRVRSGSRGQSGAAGGPTGSTRSAEHDPLRLAAALRDVLEGAWGDVG